MSARSVVVQTHRDMSTAPSRSRWRDRAGLHCREQSGCEDRIQPGQAARGDARARGGVEAEVLAPLPVRAYPGISNERTFHADVHELASDTDLDAFSEWAKDHPDWKHWMGSPHPWTQMREWANGKVKGLWGSLE